MNYPFEMYEMKLYTCIYIADITVYYRDINIATKASSDVQQSMFNVHMADIPETKTEIFATLIDLVTNVTKTRASRHSMIFYVFV